MCGIVGTWHFDGRPVDVARLRAATESIRHRGPDDEGYLLVDPDGSARPYAGERTPTELRQERLPAEDRVATLAFGFRRLAILDPSPQGHQPMVDATGRRWIVYNGEIYNFVELREELTRLGYRFRSGADTEVVLAAYDAWGVDCVARFNGMFAFSLWDGTRRSLFCARDRFGVKPYYYRHSPAGFQFCSEVKGLLPWMEDRRPDWGYLRRFLETGRAEDRDRTFLAGVHALPPAHILLVRPEGLMLRRFWDVDIERAREEQASADAIERFRALFADSVRLQLRSDVPVGTCASGGIDSSAIVSLATRAFGHQMHSFSAVYADPGYDERTFVDLVTRENQTLATRVTPAPDRWFEILPRLTWHQDGPTSAAGQYTQWHVMEAAAGKVTVLLDGQGGDELFAGYFRYLPVLVRQLWRAGRVFRAASETVALAHVWRQHFEEWRAGQFLQAGLRRLRGSRGRAVDVGFLRGELPQVAPLVPEHTIPVHLDELNRVLYRDVMVESVPMLLRFEDRSSMAHHLEARVPFLDHRVVEFALSVPGDRKVVHGLSKAFLRRALAGIVPAAILARRDKKGYPTPFAQWLRGPLRESAWAFLNEMVLPRGWYDPAALARRWGEHQRGVRDWSAEIGTWMTAELWYRQVIEGRGAGL